jgi:hypothetical protein
MRVSLPRLSRKAWRILPSRPSLRRAASGGRSFSFPEAVWDGRATERAGLLRGRSRRRPAGSPAWLQEGSGKGGAASRSGPAGEDEALSRLRWRRRAWGSNGCDRAGAGVVRAHGRPGGMSRPLRSTEGQDAVCPRRLPHLDVFDVGPCRGEIGAAAPARRVSRRAACARGMRMAGGFGRRRQRGSPSRGFGAWGRRSRGVVEKESTT